MTVKNGLLWKVRLGIVMMFFFTLPSIAPAQNWGKVITGLWKTHQAISITDEKLAEMVAEEVAYMDSQHKVLGESNAYTKRLKRVMSGINSVEGLELNFKVYKTSELNAFACPDGSVRVFSGLIEGVAQRDDAQCCLRRHRGVQRHLGRYLRFLPWLGEQCRALCLSLQGSRDRGRRLWLRLPRQARPQPLGDGETL